MGTNSKHYNDHQRTFNNTSPSNRKQSPSSQRPSPSKSINIKTPNKNYNVAGKNNNYYNNNYNNNNNATRLSLSGSPTTSFFAASKCFESPSANSLPKPPSTWISNGTTLTSSQASRVRKALIMSTEPPKATNSSCAMEFAAASSIIDKNDHFTQNLKLLLNVNA